ncbi:MAG: hypothetical protein HFJ36_01310 [Clostridia bacterium]|nr:hypothetical protein [Clostridia bacterium]
MRIKNEKAITLIALVITIIILLILAGISIATLTGENGMLTKAEISKEETQISSYKEQLEIIWNGVNIEKYEANVTQEELMKKCKDKIEKDSNFENAKVEIIDDIIEVITKEGYIFHIIDGKVIYVKKEDEEQKDIIVKLNIGEIQNKKVTLTAEALHTGGRKLNYILNINGEEITTLSSYNTTFTYEYATSFGEVQAFLEVKYDDDKLSKSNVVTIEDYTIAKVEELIRFSQIVNSGNNYAGKTIELISEIDLQGSETNQWTPILNFRGSFNGNNNIIKNVYINSSQNEIGFFKNILGTSSIKEMQLENVTIKGKINTGGIVGFVNSTGTIENCIIKSGTIEGQENTGGIAGQTNNNTSKISGCKVYADVIGGVTTGGIVGNNSRPIENCAMYKNTTSNVATNAISLTGGIVGDLHNNYIFSCVNKGNVTGQSYIGGITGDIRAGTYISYCYNTGNVSRRICLWWHYRRGLW